MGLIQALKACKDTQLWDKGAFCIPTFPGSSAAWKPGPRKEILSNQGERYSLVEIKKLLTE